MRDRDDKTPYGFPPLLDQRLPAKIPWDTGIAELTGFCIEIACPDCGTVSMPLRYLAARIGHKRTLRSIVPRLRCKKCGGRPSLVRLRRMNDAGGSADRQAAGLDLLARAAEGG